MAPGIYQSLSHTTSATVVIVSVLSIDKMFKLFIKWEDWSI